MTKPLLLPLALCVAILLPVSGCAPAASIQTPAPKNSTAPSATAPAATATPAVAGENDVSATTGQATMPDWRRLAIAEAQKQLAGRRVAYDQRFDFVYRDVVCAYFPGYRPFTSLADARTLFPYASFPEDVQGYRLAQAELRSELYHEDGITTLQSSPHIGEIYAAGSAEPVYTARLTYEKDQAQLIITYHADAPGDSIELFAQSGYRCVAKESDPVQQGKYYLCTVLTDAPGYFEVSWMEHSDLIQDMQMVGKTPEQLKTDLAGIAFADFAFSS
ncbi:MAG: hypothetical protein PHO66_00540 [Eubacteriales bacterium]|nr:hypothetical protein [Eubacteriales bacterium]